MMRYLPVLVATFLVPAVCSSQALSNPANRTTAFGDSIIRGGATDTQWTVLSWFTHAVIGSRSSITFHHNAGLNGDTTAGMLARIQSDVISGAPGKCLVSGGTNDVGNNTPTDQIISNLTQIVSLLRGAGIQPILCTLPPRGKPFQTRVLDLNTGIKTLAAASGIPLIDVYTAVAHPKNGGWQNGLSNDGIHPTEAGAQVIGNVAIQALRNLYSGYPYVPTSATDASNLVTNGLFLNGTSSWFANGWTNEGSVTVVSNTAGNGMWAQLKRSVKAVGHYYNFQQDISIGFSPGERIAFAGRIQAPDSVKGGLRTSIELDFVDPSGNYIDSIRPMYRSGTDIADGQWYIEGLVPAGTRGLSVRVVLEDGTRTVRVGQVGVVNLSRAQ